MVGLVITLSAILLFEPNATYFISPKLNLPWHLTMTTLLLPLLSSCAILGLLSLRGHYKVVHFTK
jgi:hypothetical protein